MPNYAASVLAKGQALVTSRNQQPEQRRKMPTVFELALNNQEFSIPNAQELRLSPLRPVEISYFLDVSAGAATAKAYNHTGTMGNTAAVQVVYVSHVETFSLNRKANINTIATYDQMFANRYEMAWKNLRTRQDTSALNFLYANRTQLAAGVMNPTIASANPGTWDDSNFFLNIPSTSKQLFIQQVKNAMSARNYAGELDLIADLQLAGQFDYASQQGAGNLANIAYQFAGTNIAVTQSQIDANAPLGAVLALPKGMFSGLLWNEGLNKTGLTQDIGGPVGTLGTINDPFGSKAEADISMYTNRADTSADTGIGSTQDIIDQWELTVTVGYVLPPLSLALDSVVMEFMQGA